MPESRFNPGKEEEPRKGRLRRLNDGAYQGFACVHWSASLARRATGWLNPLFHARFRESILHVCARYHLACAVYCLMPDHGHFIFHGLSLESDQQLGNTLLRREWSRLLPSGVELQRQAYDHVLREKERERDAFIKISHYILENPVRAGLVTDSKDWPFSGSLLPGYPSLEPRREGFWNSFWLAHGARVEALGKM